MAAKWMFPNLHLIWVGLLLCIPQRVTATEFGGVVTLSFPSNLIETILVPQLKDHGAISWLRTSSSSLSSQGFNQVAVLAWPRRPSLLDHGRDLPDDLLDVYWHCRTNYPVYQKIKQAWEVWNEPDFHFVRENPDRMAAVMKAAFLGVKAGNSNAIVLMPSLAFTPSRYEVELFRNNAFAYSQGYNYHFYGWPQDFLMCMRHHESFLRAHGLNLPIWITEAGYFQLNRSHAIEPIDLARQQTFHERLAIDAFMTGTAVYLPFILTPYTEGGYDLSLTFDNLAARPALDSYLFLSRWLPKTIPIYQVWHLPSESEIGVVLREEDGFWRTVLWTPTRWKDVVLPAEETGAAPDHPGDRTAPSTDLSLELRFAPSDQIAQSGLKSPRALGAKSTFRINVSATNNAFLKTSPGVFRIQDCELRALSQKPQPDHPSPISAPPGRVSPVVVQINYNPEEVRSHKPSLTYRYTSNLAIHATLALYNLSDTRQRGACSLEVPSDWRATPLAEDETANASFRTLSTEQFPKSTALAVELTLPPLSSEKLSILLQPPSANLAEIDGASTRQAMRTLIACHWANADSSADIAANWLEPETPAVPPAPTFHLKNWVPTPENPTQWQIRTNENGIVHLLLREPALSTGFASILCRFSENAPLDQDDHLVGEIRVLAADQVFYRVNLLTAKKESLRYTDDLRISSNWTQINWRMGDFSPSLWSQLGEDKSPPLPRVRFIRISFDGLKPGQSAEFRAFGVCRVAH